MIILLLMILLFLLGLCIIPFAFFADKAEYLSEYRQMISGYNRLTAKQKRIHETFIHPKYWYDDRKVYAQLSAKQKKIKQNKIYAKVIFLYILAVIACSTCIFIWMLICYWVLGGK
jgi:flagellar basal body-associated protein FliL